MRKVLSLGSAIYDSALTLYVKLLVSGISKRYPPVLMSFDDVEWLRNRQPQTLIVILQYCDASGTLSNAGVGAIHLSEGELLSYLASGRVTLDYRTVRLAKYLLTQTQH